MKSCFYSPRTVIDNKFYCGLLREHFQNNDAFVTYNCDANKINRFSAIHKKLNLQYNFANYTLKVLSSK